MAVAISELRRGCRNFVLNARAIERLVSLDEFGDAYSRATDADKSSVNELIDIQNKDAIELWIRSQRRDEDLSTMSTRELRALASKFGVRWYNKLPKALLLSEIRKCQDAAILSRSSTGILTASDPL